MHRQRGDGRRRVIFHPDVFAVIAIKLLEAVVPRQTGKAVDGIDRLARESLAYRRFLIEFLERIAREDEVMDRVGVVLRVGEARPLQELPEHAALGLVLRTAYQEAGF